MDAAKACVSAEGGFPVAPASTGGATPVRVEGGGPLAALRMRLDQRPPGAFVRAVDGQQPLGGGQNRGWLVVAGQGRLGERGGVGHHASSLLDEPAVEGWIEAAQIVHERSLEQLEHVQPGGTRRRQRVDVDPEIAAVEAQMGPLGPQRVVADPGQALLQLVHRLTQRAASLLAFPRAPEQLRQVIARQRSRRAEGEHAEQGPGLAAARQHRLSEPVLRCHGAEQLHPQLRGRRLAAGANKQSGI